MLKTKRQVHEYYLSVHLPPDPKYENWLGKKKEEEEERKEKEKEGKGGRKGGGKGKEEGMKGTEKETVNEAKGRKVENEKKG